MKIHMCCGKRDFGPDWLHIDGEAFPHVSVVTDRLDILPFASECAELIYCSHAIEYFDREEIVPVLQEWRRILKPGGTLRLAVPDFEAMISLYNDCIVDLKDILGPLYGKMKMGNKTIYHKTVYDFQSLDELLRKVGFKNIGPWDWHTTEHAHVDDHSQAYIPHMDKENGTLISLNVECEK